jgi:hypothetical protein
VYYLLTLLAWTFVGGLFAALAGAIIVSGMGIGLVVGGVYLLVAGAAYAKVQQLYGNDE